MCALLLLGIEWCFLQFRGVRYVVGDHVSMNHVEVCDVDSGDMV
jgi:hypothetical protein